MRLPVEGSEFELVVVNVHFSAYDKGGEFKKQQMQMLTDFMREEAQVGNYVIVGGDFNTAFAGSISIFQNAEEIPEWVGEFDPAAIPEGYQAVIPSNIQSVGSVRDSSYKYIPGTNYETVIDGWIVSNNIQANSEIIQTAYQYSDHNPVKLSFSLLPERA
jgi:endonuclease/exonuclease/phosphatase family metal-dependent hydrolase